MNMFSITKDIKWILYVY